MYQRPSAPLPIGGVLDNAVRLLKATFKQAIGLAVAANLLTSSWRLFDDSLERMVAGTFDPAQGFGWNFALMILGALAGIYLRLVIVARMHAFSINRPTTLGEAFRRALIRYPAVLLFMLVILGGSVVFGLIALIALVGLGVAGAIFALLLLLPLGALFVYWCLASVLPVAANIGGVQAMRRSFNLVVNNFWRTLTFLTVMLFVELAATAAVGAIAAALGALAGFGNLSYDAVFFVVELVAGSVTTPFMVAAMLALLHDLELRREGEDLAQRIEALQ